MFLLVLAGCPEQQTPVEESVSDSTPDDAVETEVEPAVPVEDCFDAPENGGK